VIHVRARAVVAIVVLALLATCRRAGAVDDEVAWDCGTNALHVLLHFEGRPTSLDRLLSVLPAPSPEGHSMAELAAASRALGLSLDGVRLGPGDPRPDRASIAYVKTPQGGHFMVVRPVGSLGGMVQVVDPPLPPLIVDFDRLTAAGGWTGRVLTPRTRGGRSAALFVGGLAIASLVVAVRPRRRQPSAPGEC